MAVKKISSKTSFEEALAQLEAQVEQLESGSLSLEQSLNVFKQGVELSAFCAKKLETTKQEVEKIMLQNSAEAEYSLELFPEMED